MKRREFITFLSGLVAWPLAVRAQQPERMRRIGILFSLGADDQQGQARRAAFVQSLRELSWTEGRNVSIETRWAAGNAADMRKYAAELVALSPDVILANSAVVLAPLLEITKSVPVVFVLVADPVALAWSIVWRGLVATLQVSLRSNTASGANFWSFSKRSRRVRTGRQLFGIPLRQWGLVFLERSKTPHLPSA